MAAKSCKPLIVVVCCCAVKVYSCFLCFLSPLSFKSFPVPPLSLPVPVGTSVSIQVIGVMECLTAGIILMNKAAVCYLHRIMFCIITDWKFHSLLKFIRESH